MKNLIPRKVAKIRTILLICGAIVAFLGVARNENLVLIFGGMAVMIASSIFHIIFYRCPHCGKFLDRSAGEYCPYCSKEVNKI